MRREAKVGCPTEKTKRELYDAREPTHEARARSWEEAGEDQASGRHSSVRGATCAKIFCDNGESRRFPIPRRAGKYIVKTSFTNKSKYAAIKCRLGMMGSWTFTVWNAIVFIALKVLGKYSWASESVPHNFIYGHTGCGARHRVPASTLYVIYGCDATFILHSYCQCGLGN